MDPIEAITPKKDSSLAMLLEAERRECEIYYFEQEHLRLSGGTAIGDARQAQMRLLEVVDLPVAPFCFEQHGERTVLFGGYGLDRVHNDSDFERGVCHGACASLRKAATIQPKCVNRLGFSATEAVS